MDMLEQSQSATPETVARLMAAFARKCSMAGKTIPHDKVHTCTRACKFWWHPKARDYFVCESSGKIHVCGERCKAHRFVTRETTCVCCLTGIELTGCDTVSTFADATRTTGGAVYNHQSERKRQTRFVTECAIQKRLRDCVWSQTTEKQVRDFARACVRVFDVLGTAQASTWDPSCSRSSKLFALVMLLEMRSTTFGPPVAWISNTKFSDVQRATKGFALNKMQKSIKRILQNRALRPHFNIFNTFIMKP
jgi:hypothetical protein